MKCDKEKRVQFIVLFGSVAEGKSNSLSDIDIAVYYDGTSKERFVFRMSVLGALPGKCDVHIFQDLPVGVQKEVISGKVLYSRNFQFIFNEYLKVIRSYHRFEKYINCYIEAIEGGKSGA